jgi:hypothetical protein
VRGSGPEVRSGCWLCGSGPEVRVRGSGSQVRSSRAHLCGESGLRVR